MTWHAPEHDPTGEVREQLDAAGWRAAMGEVAARHGLDPAGLAPFESGSDAVWGDGRVVLKVSLPRWTGQMASEARFLRWVEGRLDVRTPRVLHTGDLDGWPYLVMDHVPGRAVARVWPELAHDERARLARELGLLTASLQALPTSDAARFGIEDDWLAFAAANRREPARRLARGNPPAHFLAEVEPFLARVGPLDERRRVLLHTELLGEHVLVGDGPRPSFVGLIDLADARLGPPAYETAAPVEFLFHGEPGLLDAYLSGLLEGGGDPGAHTAEERLAWALLHRFGHLVRMVRAVGDPVPADLSELARRLYGTVAD